MFIDITCGQQIRLPIFFLCLATAILHIFLFHHNQGGNVFKEWRVIVNDKTLVSRMANERTGIKKTENGNWCSISVFEDFMQQGSKKPLKGFSGKNGEKRNY